MTASAIYTGTIRHRRFAEREREFEHHIAMAYVDLDELPTLLNGRLVAKGRGLVRFRRSDYFGEGDLGAAVREAVGVEALGGVRVLTQLRTLGHCFNPVSFYYCFDADERLEALLAEVTNTPWSERQAYVLHRSSNGVLKGESEKQMHVSPFFGIDQTYDWRVATPGETLSVHIENWERGTKAFDATLALKREELTQATLAKTAGASLKTLALIYSHAAAIRASGIAPHKRGLSPKRKRLRFRAPATKTPHGERGNGGTVPYA